MMTNTLLSRTYAGEVDLAAIAAFLNLVEAHDQVEDPQAWAHRRAI